MDFPFCAPCAFCGQRSEFYQRITYLFQLSFACPSGEEFIFCHKKHKGHKKEKEYNAASDNKHFNLKTVVEQKKRRNGEFQKSLWIGIFYRFRNSLSRSPFG